MRSFHLAVAIAITSFVATSANADWQPLVGDKMTDFWTTEGAWEQDDSGVIHLPDREYKHWRNYENYLVLKERLVTDFEFEFDWKTEGNSGLYFHVPDLGNVPERKHVEVQIYENSKWTKPELGDHAAGGIIPGHAPTKDACKPYGEWNTMNVKCVDNQLTVTLNGQIVNEVDLNKGKTASRSKVGGFAFQDHGHPVWLKDIRMKDLGK